MIEAAEWAGTIARAAAVAVASTAIAAGIRPLLDHAVGRVFVLFPLVVPRLFVGYAWANHAPGIALDPIGREFLYPALTLVFTVPLALLVLALVPPTFGREARHVRSLASPRPSRALRWRQRLASPMVAAGALAFVAAFAEFDLASLFAVDTWSVALFDAQVGGTTLATTLAAAAPGAITQAVGLGLFLFALSRLHRDGDRPDRSRGSAAAWGYACAAAIAVGLLPVWWILPDAWSGLPSLANQGTFFRDVAAGVGLAAAAALIADRVAGTLTGGSSGSSGAPRAIWMLALAPGLAGPLVLGLLALWLFQLPGLALCYDTPLPWLLALSLALLPYAVILRAGLRDGRGRSVHTARLVRGAARRRIEWSLVGRRRYAVLAVLFLIAAFETTLASLLAPTGMTAAMTRLYNFMHYGRSAALAALVALTIAAPIVVFGATRLIAPRVRWAVPHD